MEIVQLMFIFKQLSSRALLQVHCRWGKRPWLKRGAVRLMGAAACRGGECLDKPGPCGAGGLGDRLGLQHEKPREGVTGTVSAGYPGGTTGAVRN